MFVATQSRKSFKDGGRKGLEYSPMIGPPFSDDEGTPQTSPVSTSQLIRQGFP